MKTAGDNFWTADDEQHNYSDTKWAEVQPAAAMECKLFCSVLFCSGTRLCDLFSLRAEWAYTLILALNPVPFLQRFPDLLECNGRLLCKPANKGGQEQQ
jgi:hypothetical protein